MVTSCAPTSNSELANTVATLAHEDDVRCDTLHRADPLQYTFEREIKIRGNRAIPTGESRCPGRSCTADSVDRSGRVTTEVRNVMASVCDLREDATWPRREQRRIATLRNS